MDSYQANAGLVEFKRPTFTRLQKLLANAGRISVLRCLEYERLAELNLTGRVLDFGGGSKTNYADQVAGWGRSIGSFEYQSANIDPRTEPTYLLQPGAPLPCEAECFDTVLSFNTFEHIYDVTSVLRDLHRVTKQGGQIIYIVPFIFRVHGHPSDYSRHTPAYWQQKLAEAGFTLTKIEALHWGPFSVASTVTGLPGPFKRTRLRLSIIMDFLLSLRRRKSNQIEFEQDHSVVNCPLGYFVTAIRT